MGTPEDILSFWLDEKGPEAWYAGGDALDAEIKEKFEDDWNRAMAGTYSLWLTYPSGTLAYNILTDQFPRNIYRGQEKSFAYDPVALALAQQAIATGIDQELPAIRRVFMYLPLEHSENLSDQQQCLALFTDLAESAPEEEKELFDGFLDFARRHLEVIERFGRFPHRNKILGRVNSAEETEFLNQPGSSF